MATIFSVSNTSCTSLACQKSKKSTTSVHLSHISKLKKGGIINFLKKQTKIKSQSPPQSPCDGMTPSREPDCKYTNNTGDCLFTRGTNQVVPQALSRAARAAPLHRKTQKRGDSSSDESEHGEGRRPLPEYVGRRGMRSEDRWMGMESMAQARDVYGLRILAANVDGDGGENAGRNGRIYGDEGRPRGFRNIFTR